MFGFKIYILGLSPFNLFLLLFNIHLLYQDLVINDGVKITDRDDTKSVSRVKFRSFSSYLKEFFSLI